MSDIVAWKIKDATGETNIVIFKRGEFSTPLAILDKRAIADINKEWNRTDV
jgi:hypothetical protein